MISAILKHNAPMEADGSALAAIQGFNQKRREEPKRRRVENAELWKHRKTMQRC